ncbi:hypothetical protein CPB86DRAFT_751707 [Serendipita vermifera]|nr:hypothetical protein CPB86DRAFT_751707 [Serendipita vermifera]
MLPPSCTNLSSSSTSPHPDSLPATSLGERILNTSTTVSVVGNQLAPRTPPETLPSLWFIPHDLQLPSRLQVGPSHSKRQPASHIPRPRNPFILFRSHFLSMKILPVDIDFCRDHRQISRIVSCVWSVLPAHEKERFFRLGEEEKKRHQTRYPSYKIAARDPTMKPATENEPINESLLNSEEIKCRRIAEAIVSGLQGQELRSKIQSIVQEDSFSNDTPAATPPPPSEISEPISPRNSPRIPVLAALSLPKYRANKAPVSKSLQTKPRSSSSDKYVGKGALLTSIYARRCNPPRHTTQQVSYIECDSDYQDELTSDSENTSLMSDGNQDLSGVPNPSTRGSSLAATSITSPSNRATSPSIFEAENLLQGVSLNDSSFSGIITSGDGRNDQVKTSLFEPTESFSDIEIDPGSPYSEFGVHYDCNSGEDTEPLPYYGHVRSPQSHEPRHHMTPEFNQYYDSLLMKKTFVNAPHRKPSLVTVCPSLLL